MTGRENVVHALNALKHTIPGFENAKLRNIAMTIGARDSRKIVGKYNLTGADVRGQLRCDDTIGVFPEFIDGYSILILPTSGPIWLYCSHKSRKFVSGWPCCCWGQRLARCNA